VARPAETWSQLTCFRFFGPKIAGKFQFSGWVIRAAGRGRTMKRSKFTEAQIAFILRQADEGTAIGEVCRQAGISEATFYNWRKRYAGLMPSEMKRLRQLEEENGKLKKIVADLSLDKAMLQDVIRRKL
jgi:putative transposase